MLGRVPAPLRCPGLEVRKQQGPARLAVVGAGRDCWLPEPPHPSQLLTLGHSILALIVTSTSEESGDGPVPGQQSRGRPGCHLPSPRPLTSKWPAPDRAWAPARASTARPSLPGNQAAGCFPLGKVLAHGVLRLPAWEGTAGALKRKEGQGSRARSWARSPYPGAVCTRGALQTSLIHVTTIPGGGPLKRLTKQ